MQSISLSDEVGSATHRDGFRAVWSSRRAPTIGPPERNTAYLAWSAPEADRRRASGQGLAAQEDPRRRRPRRWLRRRRGRPRRAERVVRSRVAVESCACGSGRSGPTCLLHLRRDGPRRGGRGDPDARYPRRRRTVSSLPSRARSADTGEIYRAYDATKAQSARLCLVRRLGAAFGEPLGSRRCPRQRPGGRYRGLRPRGGGAGAGASGLRGARGFDERERDGRVRDLRRRRGRRDRKGGP